MLRQEDHKFKDCLGYSAFRASLGNPMRLCLKARMSKALRHVSGQWESSCPACTEVQSEAGQGGVMEKNKRRLCASVRGLLQLPCAFH